MTVFRHKKNGKLYKIQKNMRSFFTGTGIYAEPIGHDVHVPKAKLNDFTVAWIQ